MGSNMTRQAHSPLTFAAAHLCLQPVNRGEAKLVCVRHGFLYMQAQLRGVFDAAVAGGITFFDTAEVRSTWAWTLVLADVSVRCAACWPCC